MFLYIPIPIPCQSSCNDNDDDNYILTTNYLTGFPPKGAFGQHNAFTLHPVLGKLSIKSIIYLAFTVMKL